MVSEEKYRMELIEILMELIAFKPSLSSQIGVPDLFNWRALFDFSSHAWAEFSNEHRTAIINGLAEKGSLFLALLTFKNYYMEIGRPDIAGASGLSLAKFLEDIVAFEYSYT